MDSELRSKLKGLIVENLMLPMSPQEIGDDDALFGPGGLELDSVDALQLVVVLDKNFGVKVSDPEEARKVLTSVATMAETVTRHAS